MWHSGCKLEFMTTMLQTVQPCLPNSIGGLRKPSFNYRRGIGDMNKKLSTLLSFTLAGSALLAPGLASADMTGNIGVFSKYVLRGITNNAENDGAALQGGFDYTHASGFYAGWWGSSLDYASAPTQTGFENDFYGGWSGKTGDVSYSVGVIQYYYMEVDDSNLTEFVPTIGYGPVTLGAKYLLNDGAWGNQGDIYWTLSYGTDLPSDFKLGAVVGYYTYEKDDNDKMCGGTTGADMSVTYTLGGKDRTGTDQRDIVGFGVKYGFSI